MGRASAWRSRFLQKTLLASSSGGILAGTEHAGSMASPKASAIPAASGASGPITRQVDREFVAELDEPRDVRSPE